MNKFSTETQKMAMVARLVELRTFERSLVEGYNRGVVSEVAYIEAMEASEQQEAECLAAGITRKDLQSV